MTNNKTTLESILRDIQTINTLAQEVGTKVAMLKNKETLSELDDPRIGKQSDHRPAEQAVAKAEISFIPQSRNEDGGPLARLRNRRGTSDRMELKEEESDINDMISDMFV